MNNYEDSNDFKYKKNKKGENKMNKNIYSQKHIRLIENILEKSNKNCKSKEKSKK